MRLKSYLAEQPAMSLDEVKAWYEEAKYSARSLVEFTLVSPGMVDIDGSFCLRKRAANIPFKIRKLRGTFDPSDSYLTSLVNGPDDWTQENTDDYYSLSNTELTSLKGLPKVFDAAVLNMRGMLHELGLLPLLELSQLRRVNISFVDYDTIDDEHVSNALVEALTMSGSVRQRQLWLADKLEDLGLPKLATL